MVNLFYINRFKTFIGKEKIILNTLIGTPFVILLTIMAIASVFCGFIEMTYNTKMQSLYQISRQKAKMRRIRLGRVRQMR